MTIRENPNMGKRPGLTTWGSNFGAVMALAFEFAGAVALFWGLGWLADDWFGTEPWGQIVGSVLGWIGGTLHVFYAVERLNKSSKKGIER